LLGCFQGFFLFFSFLTHDQNGAFAIDQKTGESQPLNLTKNQCEFFAEGVLMNMVEKVVHDKVEVIVYNSQGVGLLFCDSTIKDFIVSPL